MFLGCDGKKLTKCVFGVRVGGQFESLVSVVSGKIKSKC
jgi:hypothetical protein